MMMLRLLLAGCFAYAALMAFGGLLALHDEVPDGPVLLLIILPILIAILLLVKFIFSPWYVNAMDWLPANTARKLLERKGILVTNSYDVSKACLIEEANNEGPHYLLEVDHGLVLYLSSQDLYKFEPSDEPDDIQPRRFPCTRITVIRHERLKQAVEVRCEGPAFEPELTVPYAIGCGALAPYEPKDGWVIEGAQYEHLRNNLAQGG